MIDLPEGTDACDIGELTIWCRPFRVYFSSITLNHDVLFVSYVISTAVGWHV